MLRVVALSGLVGRRAILPRGFATSMSAAAAPTIIAELQVLPSPTGTAANEFEHVEAAIAVIAGSGLEHSVHALGTTIEGPPDAVWAVARSAFDAALESGADKELMILKLYQGGSATVSSLVSAFP